MSISNNNQRHAAELLREAAACDAQAKRLRALAAKLTKGVAPPVREPLEDLDLDILSTLSRKGGCVKLNVLADAIDADRDRISRRTSALEVMGMVVRPGGQAGRKGAAITDAGRAAIAALNPH